MNTAEKNQVMTKHQFNQLDNASRRTLTILDKEDLKLKYVDAA
jgi:hypothetical protein